MYSKENIDKANYIHKEYRDQINAEWIADGIDIDNDDVKQAIDELIAERESKRILENYKMDSNYFNLYKYRWNYSDYCMWFRDAGLLLGRTPTLKDFRQLLPVLYFETDSEKLMFLQLHYRLPKGYKKYFRSSQQAYRMALEFYDIGKRNKYGYTCLAKDGHSCNSLAEAKIDDYLFENKINHEKEPRYPGTTWRADFKVGEVYIEYFGLTGNKKYDEKTKAKIEYANENSIDLISIYPNDTIDQWKQKLKHIYE